MQQCGDSAESTAFYNRLVAKSIEYKQEYLCKIKQIFEPIGTLDQGFFLFTALISGVDTLIHTPHPVLLDALCVLLLNRPQITLPKTSRYPTGAKLLRFIQYTEVVLAEFAGTQNDYFVLFFDSPFFDTIRGTIDAPSVLPSAIQKAYGCNGLPFRGACGCRIGGSGGD